MNETIYNEIPLKTKRLIIEKINVEELLKINRGIAEEEKYKLTCRPILKRKEKELRSFYEDLLKDSSNIILGIKRREDRVCVGKISLRDYNPRNKSLEIGYYITKEFRRNGYMTEVLEKMLYILFNEVKINKVYAQTGEFNEGSINLLKSLGFKKDGTLRKHHELEGILYDDFTFSIMEEELEIRE